MIIVGVQEVQNTKRAKLLEHKPEEGIQEKPLYDIFDACKTQFPFDAHFFPYYLNTKEPTPIPPVAKHVLQLLRQKGHDLLTRLFALDVDTREHVPWNKKLFDTFVNYMETISDKVPEPSIVYTTKKGARLLFVLKEPIPVDKGEPYHRGLIELYSKYLNGTIKVDKECYPNWDRCYRLPQVVRDGENSWENQYYLYDEDPNTVLDISTIEPKGPKQSKVYQSFELDIQQPTPEEAKKLFKGEWKKSARKYLKNRDCFSAVFDDKAIAEPGARNTTIQIYSGQVCAMLSHLKEATPEKCYALLLNSVEYLTPDKDTSDWTVVLWNAICKYWSKEKSKQEEEKILEEEKAEIKQDKLDHIISVMQEWTSVSELHSEEDDIRRNFALGHLIAVTTNEYYIMQSNGYYHPIGTSRLTELPALIRRYGMDDIIGITKMRNNELGLKTGSEILVDYATKVKDMVGRICSPGMHIKHLGKPDARLVLDLFHRRDDLVEAAAFHPQVDTWLRAMVSREEYPILEQWLSWAPAFDEGAICALSLSGPPGIGKKLLARGLAETINTGIYATEKEFGSRYREILLKTPYLVVNEGLPKPQPGVPDVADTFRNFVSGDDIEIEPKFRTPIKINNPLRIMFTANNADIIQQLAGHRELTRNDQDALAIRVIHLETRQEAASYLRSLGGIRHTKGWIKGDSGENSKYIVAKHLLWLYLNKRHEYPQQKRFLVEGSLDSELITEMKLRAGISPQVVETILALVEDQGMLKGPSRGIHIDKTSGEAWVTNRGVADRFRKLFPTERLNGHSLRKVLQGITTEARKTRMELPNKKKSDNLVWRKLDLNLLVGEAVKNGIEHKKLSRLYQTHLEKEHMKSLQDSGEDFIC